MKIVGITTTVPVEILLAAGCKAVDLNNLFIGSAEYSKYIDLAERDGFPKSSCAWIKGIYGVCLKHQIREIIGVVEGDCSNTKALINVLKSLGVQVIPFTYPHSHKLEDIKLSLDALMDAFGVSVEKVEKVRQQLMTIRTLAKRIDTLTHAEDKATGFENHLYQVMLSDFNGSLEECEHLLKEKISEIEQRQSEPKRLRLGFIGVPPMTGDLYSFVENYNARVVYNEVQREFAFPRSQEATNIYEQYYDYTYPYDIDFRLNEINKQIAVRHLDGIIHYTQAFCYRAIDDIIIKQHMKLPVITIEGDKLNALDSRTKLRLEAFLDMLSDIKNSKTKEVQL